MNVDPFGDQKSKLFFNYGRFYESIPLDLNDRQFTGEGLVVSPYANGMGGTAACPTQPLSPGGRSLPVASSTCNFQIAPAKTGPYSVLPPLTAGGPPVTVSECAAAG